MGAFGEAAAADREGLASGGGADWMQVVFVKDGIAVPGVASPAGDTQTGTGSGGLRSRFPATATVVEALHKLEKRPTERLPRGSVELSLMRPGAVVAPHCGPTNHRLRLHLGLVVPSGAAITVAGETRRWEQGRVLAFDDSWEHSVAMNGARSPRVVLIVDVWQPGLSAAEREEVRVQWARQQAVAQLSSAFAL